MRPPILIHLTVLVALVLLAPTAVCAQDSSFEEAVTSLAGSRSAMRRGVQALGGMGGDPRALAVLQALDAGTLRLTPEERVLIPASEGGLQDAASGEAVDTGGMKLKKPRLNNAVRRALAPALARLQLLSAAPEARLAAARALIKRPQEDAEPELRAALAAESDTAVREALTVALARLDFESGHRDRRLSAIAAMGEAANPAFRADLETLLERREDGTYAEPDTAIREAARQALGSIETRLFVVTQAGNLFHGLSLGSVLLLAALGLAITFGLMGVINMAHGEMLMLGAYATFMVQSLFRAYLPGWLDWYLVAALPVAFLTSAAVGIVLERGIIRHLYGRPLETLLATWGISLVLIQSVRLLYGAQNVEVANPSWLAGGIQVTTGLVLPYNRIATVLFAIAVLSLVWALFQRSRLGLQVRAVTQNRPMAAAMGIDTTRVDMWTFGLGSGVAGLGGLALSQLGNVGPELGQAYIVDSFMVVVLGGVGKLAGAMAGALGLGIVNKFLEPATGAVLGKIIVLGFIILFIQKRPQGLFALKGRAVEA